MDRTLDYLAHALPLLPALTVVVVALAAGRLARRVLGRRDATLASRNSFQVQLANLVIGLLASLTVLVVLPVDAQLRGQLLSLYGIVLSAAIALSSTTFVGNIMAGMMLKAVRNFRTGDFIEVDGQFGKVTTRGLLSTEIQTEYRDLVTLPNLHLVTNPVKVVRASGTLIAAEVSLGYDVPHQQVTTLLEEAAADVGLVEAAALVTSLGDFSVTYRIVGLLQEVKHLLTTRSRLRQAMLDRLHGADVEIVSPNFMNQRVLDAARPVRPSVVVEGEAADRIAEPTVEEVAFDKADEAASLEELEAQLDRTRQAIAELSDDKELEPGVRSQRQEQMARRLARLEAIISSKRPPADQ